MQVLYGLVDSMYVAKLGDSALTAISLCMPVQYLAVGIGIGLGVGVNSVLSKKLGEGDKQGVNRAAGKRMESGISNAEGQHSLLLINV